MQELKTEETIEKLIDMISKFGDGPLEFETRDVNCLLNQLILQENYNDMLVSELNELKSENDRMQEHLMHNEAELIPLRKENKDLHFKNDLLEDICLTHQNLTQWIEEQIDNDPDTRIFEVSHDFLEILYAKVHKINH